MKVRLETGADRLEGWAWNRLKATALCLFVIPGTPFPAGAQHHESRLHQIDIAVSDSGSVTFTLVRVDDGTREVVLPGSFFLASCSPGDEDRNRWAREEALLWSTRGDFDDPLASTVRSIEYGTVPPGWRAGIGPKPVPTGACLVATAFTRWGPYHALVAFELREDRTVRILWRLPVVGRKT